MEPSYQQVEEDIQLLAPYTYGIRNYGTPDNEHGRWLPELCDKYGLNFYLGVWIDYNDSLNLKRLDYAIELANQNYASIKSIIVGNEFLLRSEVEQNIPLDSSEKIIVDYIQYVKERIPNSIIVSTAENIYWWEKHSDLLWETADAIYFHIYPWWDNVPLENSISHLNGALSRISERASTLNMPKKIICAETGWPSGSVNGNLQGSLENQSNYLNILHTWAKQHNLEYWYFAAFDAKWKLAYEPEVGDKWGLWNSDRTEKSAIANLAEIIPEELWWDSTSHTSSIRFALEKNKGPSIYSSYYMVNGKKKNPTYNNKLPIYRIPKKK